MTDSQLQSFVQVSSLGSFSKAEETLHVSRQAIIKQISTLEAELGFRLFDRSFKGAVLTPAGRKFLEETKDILKRVDIAIDKCREIALNEHVIRIGSPSHPRLIIEKVMNEFSKRYPQVKQELIYYSNDNIVTSLLSGMFDIAEAPYNIELLKPGISYTRLSSLPWMCLVSDAHPLASNKTISACELNGYKVGIARKKNNSDLVNELETNCPKTWIEESHGEEIPYILNFCLYRGVYLTKAFFATSLSPLRAIPLDVASVPETGVYYLSHPTDTVKLYIDVIIELYG